MFQLGVVRRLLQPFYGLDQLVHGHQPRLVLLSAGGRGGLALPRALLLQGCLLLLLVPEAVHAPGGQFNSKCDVSHIYKCFSTLKPYFFF